MYRLLQSSQQDINSIVICYKMCFPDSISTRLGNNYIRKMLEWFFADNRFLFHVTDGSKVIGYCGGFIPSSKGEGSTSGIMQYTMTEAMKGILKKPWLLFEKDIVGLYPLVIKNIRKKLFIKKKISAQSPSTTFVQNKAGLVVIGVHPDYRGSGVFEILMQAFDEAALSRNLHELNLSVRKENQRAINAYEKCGWQILKETNKGVEMYKHLNKFFA